MLLLSIILSIINHIFWCFFLCFFITLSLDNHVDPIKGFAVFPLAIFGGVFGVAGGFGAGTAAFDFLFSSLLLVTNGALVGLLFQFNGVLSRILGLPFYLAEVVHPIRDKLKNINIFNN